ncbi:N-acetylmuramic acid 6-phosphate etherase [Roseobacter cerasinus]|uniref:N-acetylmuramic acid 6-phosphate etherase n=1 Tax=Roseobacter cerasinus TaxID=2602289 RepID=A0A640VSG8_9RHOB|nr:N-acetylmuramic acid 6-phosphate etherase [Roseobacter cerasinus]GFE50747.1 N-acetylmuramic acid 6-phosphate etherase [Roseobacter cerasinus]
MSLPTTENAPAGVRIDALDARDALAAILESQAAAVAAVTPVLAQVDAAAEAMAKAIRTGGMLVYAAAGSSGLMALADACELPGTFGVAHKQIRIHMAGGVPGDGIMPGATEDDADAGRQVGEDTKQGDVAIVLSASGTTPYAIAAAQAAGSNGATVIGLANAPGSALLDHADIPICLETGAEVIAGSTRLGAGTAQKVALNMMSSLMGVKLGHVFQGMMINVVADNAKLRSRAAHMVATAAGVAEPAATDALRRAGGRVKTAVLLARGCTKADADDLLHRHDGHLAPCLQDINNKANQHGRPQ